VAKDLRGLLATCGGESICVNAEHMDELLVLEQSFTCLSHLKSS
jgi:hypothetical protein